MVWSVGDVAGLEHDVARMPERVPIRRRCRRSRERLGEADIEPHVSSSGRTSTSGPTTLDRRRLGERVSRASPTFGRWYRFVPRFDVRRSVGRRVPFADPVDTLGWPAVCQLHLRSEYIAPSIDLSCRLPPRPIRPSRGCTRRRRPSSAHARPRRVRGARCGRATATLARASAPASSCAAPMPPPP